MKLFLKNMESDEKLIGAFSIIMFLLITNNMLAFMIGPEKTNFIFIAYILKGLILCGLLFVVKDILRQLRFFGVCIYLLVILLMILSHLSFIENRDYTINTLLTNISVCLPVFILSNVINDHELFLKKLLVYSRWFSIVLVLFGYYGAYIGFREDIVYSMGFSYALLPPTIFLLISVINGSRKDILPLLVYIGVLAVFGSRGSLAVLFVYILLKAMRNSLKTFCSVIVLFPLFLVYRSDLFSLINDILFKFDITSRTLFSLSQPDISLSGREHIYSYLWNEFISDPFTVRGINAEYNIINGYAHNIFIELFYQFGVIIGGILIMLIIGLWIISFFSSSSLIFAYSIIMLVNLLVSSSLWINSNFWIWLGLLFGYYSKIRKRL